MIKFFVICTVIIVRSSAFVINLEDERIVGGTDAPEGSFPFIVSLRNIEHNYAHFCGGSIINSRTILTAEHCLTYMSPTLMIIIAGTHKLNSGGQNYTVSKLIRHERNDLALVILETPLKFSNTIRPIELQAQNNEESKECIIGGWGRPSPSGDQPKNLQYVKTHSISNDECNSFSMGVTEVDVCAFTKRGEGICNGDSGGPLVCNNLQLGIASRSVPCAAGSPDIYTRVPYFFDWIKDNMWSE